MADMDVEFLGGELAGQSRAPVNEDELAKLGYRSALMTKPHAGELTMCIAVPVAWTKAEAHQAIKEKFNTDSQRRPGKRSL